MLKALTTTDFRQLFCAALRSSKYKQVTGTRNWKPDEACALGVGWKEGVFEADFNHPFDPIAAGGSLPLDVYKVAQKKLGLSEDKIVTIFRMSDRGIPFPKIADWIEKQP